MFASQLYDKQAVRKTGDNLTSFQFLAQSTIARMKAMRSIPTFNPVFGSRKSLNQKFVLTSDEWIILNETAPVACLRMVHIQGARNEIINTWIFPFAPDQLPVFAAELIGVGDVVKVAFVDVQTPAMCLQKTDNVRSLTTPLANRFAALPCDEEAPDWAVASSPGHYTYARNVPAAMSSVIEDCYLAYLDAYLDEYLPEDHVQNGAIQSHGSHAQIALHHYQYHHMEHSPGKKFLSVLFGAEWTDAFMKSFLFSLPRG